MFSCGTQKSGRGAIVIFNTIIVTIITDQLIWNSKDIHLQISAVRFFDTFLKEANSFIGSFLKYNITHTHTTPVNLHAGAWAWPCFHHIQLERRGYWHLYADLSSAQD